MTLWWIISLLFLTSCVNTVLSNAEPNCETESYCPARPHIKVPRSTQYKTLLSMDSGAIRGLIGVLVLVELEDSIKRHILASSPENLPKDASIDDFEISLADYFDCLAGSSSGAWSVLYLASKGQSGGAADTLNEKSIIEKYGVITPSSAKALVVFYKEYVSAMFPPEVFANTAIFNPGTDPSTPGVVTPRLGPDTFLETFEKWFGDTKLSELHTSCFIPSFDLIKGLRTLFVCDKLTSKTRVGFSQVLKRRTPRSRNAPFLADVEGHFGLDFYVRDIAYGSSTGLSITPERELSPIGEPGVRLVLSDGNLYKSNPVFPALIHIANTTGDTSFTNIAVLSIGAGMYLADAKKVANGGLMQWDVSIDRFNYGAVIAEEVLVKQLKFLFSSNPKMKPGQFTRIQAVGPPGSRIEKMILDSLRCDNWDDVETAGLELTQSARSSISSSRNLSLSNSKLSTRIVGSSHSRSLTLIPQYGLE